MRKHAPFRASGSAHNPASAAAHSRGEFATRTAGFPFVPESALRVHTTGIPRAAASSSLFLIPPPLTNGSTTTCRRATSERMSGRSAWFNSFFNSSSTSFEGLRCVPTEVQNT